MATKGIQIDNRDLESKWQEEYTNFYGEREFSAKTAARIPVKPVYAASDLKVREKDEIGMPGVYPYTRGLFPLQYQFTPWMNQQIHGFGLPEHGRQRFEYLRKVGLEGFVGSDSAYFLINDMPSQAGYDADHPLARGKIGTCGSSISTLEDYEIAYGGLPLDRIHVTIPHYCASLPHLALYIVTAEKSGIPQEKLNGDIFNKGYEQWFQDLASFPPEACFKLMVELIKYCTKYMPRWNTLSLDGYDMEEAGCNSIQELSFVLATGIAITEECIKAGLEPDDFLGRFGFHMAMGMDFFEGVAKLRAQRRMWAKINSERFGCRNPKSLKARTMVQTAGTSYTAQQPMNNIIRGTIETLASVLAGVNATCTASYDEALTLPTEEAVTLALRINQVVLHETNLRNVSDPLGGSYYVESLTDRLEEEATKLIQQIDEIGYIECWKTGWFKSQYEKTAQDWQDSVDRNEKIIVGINKHVAEEEQRTDVFQFDPEVEKIAIERVKNYKAGRNNTRVKEALTGLREVAIKVGKEWPDGGDLMPAALEAARAEATGGEMMEVLREVFGWGYAF